MARSMAGGNILAPDGRAGDAFAAARRHSRRVHVLKMALPASAVLVTSAFFLWSWLATPPDTGVSVDGAAFTGGKLVMANPKLDGFSKDNQPYSMTAARAVQDIKTMGVIALEDINAKLPVTAGNMAAVTADAGIYDRDNNTLAFTTPLQVTTTDGMKAVLKTAFMDLTSGSLKTGDPVDITLNGSRITADSFSASDHGKVLVFEKRVRMTIQPDAMKAGQDKAKQKEAANGAN
ncbi:MAG: LPS export ABC transporter periplasmic protein LptC [Rhizobiaceae bacterium]